MRRWPLTTSAFIAFWVALATPAAVAVVHGARDSIAVRGRAAQRAGPPEALSHECELPAPIVAAVGTVVDDGSARVDDRPASAGVLTAVAPPEPTFVAAAPPGSAACATHAPHARCTSGRDPPV